MDRLLSHYKQTALGPALCSPRAVDLCYVALVFFSVVSLFPYTFYTPFVHLFGRQMHGDT